ncbi:hypothetical protein EC991_010259, partial [Linnemannia zychae]
MEDYLLTSEDWDQLGLMCDLLKNFANLSTKACSSTTYHVKDFIEANENENDISTPPVNAKLTGVLNRGPFTEQMDAGIIMVDEPEM